ncbi:MAG: putative capsid protein [Cressdnaviricota sp.]|nr:MAG: putative capsid protein [Cressdnaviricota sp.]
MPMKRTVTGDMKVYSRARAARAKGRKYSRAKASRVPPGVKEYVKQAVHAGRELKTANPLQIGGTGPALFGESMTFVDLMPIIQNNTLVSGRIGNKIRVKKAYMRLQLSMRPQELANNYGPIFVDLYIIKNRAQGNAPITSDFLDDGSTALPYNSNANFNSGLLDVNTDLVQQKFRKRVLMFSTTDGGAGIVTNGATPQAYDMYIDCTSMLKDTWMFDDTSIYPTNDNLFFGIAGTRSAGPAADIFGGFNLAFHVKYEDA